MNKFLIVAIVVIIVVIVAFCIYDYLKFKKAKTFLTAYKLDPKLLLFELDDMIMDVHLLYRKGGYPKGYDVTHKSIAMKTREEIIGNLIEKPEKDTPAAKNLAKQIRRHYSDFLRDHAKMNDIWDALYRHWWISGLDDICIELSALRISCRDSKDALRNLILMGERDGLITITYGLVDSDDPSSIDHFFGLP